MFAVVVTFKLKPGSAPAFNPIMIENAEASVRDEPGCHQFQVLHDQGDAETIVLYEVYEDEDAFQAHLETPHFATFEREGKPMIDEANIQRCTVLKT
jgi:(4S)-4-hydroxy-5-phosphonooxypentane-2,3-dione isomerase